MLIINFMAKSTEAAVSGCSSYRCLKHFAIFTGKHRCWSLQYRYFPVNIAKFLRIAFLWKVPGGCFWKKQFRIAQFSVYRSVCLEFVGAVTPETIFKKKATVQFL